ncbi:hypothetical protein R50073_08860 [Maricurvus nonylphenolicus]|uniref:TlpA family protein disulfide reductase n=1 Tax=Maricurvus nonylphenolicus TaxID=1008307 RepID=UPI0036F44051
MNKFFYLLLLVTGLSGGSVAAATQTGALLSTPLSDLRSQNSIALQEYAGKWVLASFFEPNCSWCFRQMKAFTRLTEKCSHIQPVAIGINGNRQKLRKEVRKAKIKYPAVVGSRALLDVVGEVPATPWTLIIDPEGNTLATLRGYHPLEQLGPALACE